MMSVGLSAMITGLYHVRVEYAIREWEVRGRFWTGLGRLMILDATFAGGSAWLTAYVAPQAQGSGLPEVKGFLNGSRITGLWRVRTFVVRFLAIGLAIGAGLVAGPLRLPSAGSSSLTTQEGFVRRTSLESLSHWVTHVRSVACLKTHARRTASRDSVPRDSREAAIRATLERSPRVPRRHRSLPSREALLTLATSCMSSQVYRSVARGRRCTSGRRSGSCCGRRCRSR